MYHITVCYPELIILNNSLVYAIENGLITVPNVTRFYGNVRYQVGSMSGHLLHCDAPAKYHYANIEAPYSVWILILEVLRFGVGILNKDGGAISCMDEWSTIVSLIDTIENSIGIETSLNK